MNEYVALLFETGFSLLIGAMVFFPAVVAPTVFRVLDAAAGGRFLRALFPRYYLFVIITAAVAGIAAVSLNLVYSAIFALIALSTLFVRQWLVPRINAWRDADIAGDVAAKRKFASGHRVSVLINIAQLVAAIGVAVHYSLTS